jgi:hypothetical protein
MVNYTCHEIKLKVLIVIEKDSGVSEGFRKFVEDLSEKQAKKNITSSTEAVTNTLKSIFSSCTDFEKRIEQATFCEEIETSLGLALKTMQGATNNSFCFNITTFDRYGFYRFSLEEEDDDGFQFDPYLSARLMIVNLEKNFAVSKNDFVQEKFVVIVVNDQIFHTSISKVSDPDNLVDNFLVQKIQKDTKNFAVSSVSFYQRMSNDFSYDNFDGYERVSECYTKSVPKFVNQFMADYLPSVVGPNKLVEAGRALKAIGLIP